MPKKIMKHARFKEYAKAFGAYQVQSRFLNDPPQGRRKVSEAFFKGPQDYILRVRYYSDGRMELSPYSIWIPTLSGTEVPLWLHQCVAATTLIDQVTRVNGLGPKEEWYAEENDNS